MGNKKLSAMDNPKIQTYILANDFEGYKRGTKFVGYIKSNILWTKNDKGINIKLFAGRVMPQYNFSNEKLSPFTLAKNTDGYVKGWGVLGKLIDWVGTKYVVFLDNDGKQRRLMYRFFEPMKPEISNAEGKTEPQSESSLFSTKNIVIGIVLVVGIIGVLKYKKVI